MIYPYIKVNSKVADILGVTDLRPRFADGCYMLWKFDLMPIGGNNEETLRMIGGVGMTSAQVRAEQRGETVTPLPEPEDPRYRVDEEDSSSSSEEADSASGSSEEAESVTSSSEETEAASSGSSEETETTGSSSEETEPSASSEEPAIEEE